MCGNMMGCMGQHMLNNKVELLLHVEQYLLLCCLCFLSCFNNTYNSDDVDGMLDDDVLGTCCLVWRERLPRTMDAYVGAVVSGCATSVVGLDVMGVVEVDGTC